MKRIIAVCCTCAIVTALLAMQAQTPATEAASSPAARMFERLKSLAGEWEAKNADGSMTCAQRYEVIARGSCVMETCEINAKPDQTMITMYHMDGDHLMLTHYCMAKNQPRMRATEFGDDGRTVTFTFFDATNLKSRDVGHMDKAWFSFTDADHFVNKWTWYADGKEAWMEEFQFTRRPPAGG